MKVKALARELAALPLRRNTIRAQRRALGLSRAKLARILEVDPSTVYRQELHNPMSMLWDYALRGIAAEASKNRPIIREHKAELARRDELLGATRLDAMGQRLTAERMREAEREQSTKESKESTRPRRNPPDLKDPPETYKPRRRPRFPTREETTAAVERAIARSKERP